MVEHNFPSSARAISSKFSLHTGKFSSPTFFTDAPSTNLSISFNSQISPFLKASYMAGAPLGSTPIILVFGLKVLKTLETPAESPPPPTGRNK